ncbi:hypothetical protein [Actinomadura sp. KC06]|uniref:hypothetical protein n=1 Tax=Actinomadura sp. KC06 TaxID=2530369 RepID=UPI001404AE15|nr:hypothetical protein [Actinomadura sp. KC06]
MRWPPWSQPYADDEALDAVLAAGDAELLNHVRLHADPTRVLAVLLDELPRENLPDLTTTFKLAGPAQQIQVRTFIFGLVYDLDCGIELVHDLVLALARDFDPAHVDVIAHAHARVRAFGHTLDLGRTLGHALVRDVALYLDLDHVRDHFHDLDRALGLDLGLARGPAQARDFVRVHIRVHALAFALDAALSGARFLEDFLVRVEIDASGADLADLELAESSLAEVLAGVVWDEDTRWPPRLRESVAARSEEIKPGVYRVRGGTERDPHEAAGV